MGKSGQPYLLLLLVLLGGLVMFPRLAAAYTADGVFTDWQGNEGISDPLEGSAASDLINFRWGTNSGESKIFFYIARSTIGKAKLYCRIWVDTDDNGRFDEPQDRLLLTEYNPSSAFVSLYIRDGQGRNLFSRSGKWGEKFFNGGSRFELAVPFTELGIMPGQIIQVYVEASSDQSYSSIDRLPDAGIIQLAPVPTLSPGLWLLLLAVLAAAASRRRWKDV